MRIPAIHTSLFALSLTALPVLAQTPVTASASATVAVPVAAQAQASSELRAAVSKALAIRDGLQKPLEVNGIQIDPLEVERQTLYRVGQRQIREKLIEMIIDEQIRESIEEGKRKKAEFDVMEKEVQKSIDEQKKAFADKYPDKDFYSILQMQGVTPEEFVTMTRTTILFDKIFFPGVPKNWPDITKECIIAAGGEQGADFMKKLEESVKPGQVVPPLFLRICRQWVLQKLEEWSDVRYASDGIPPQACMMVNNKPWLTVDASRALALKIRPEDRANALTELALWTAVKGELKKAGKWLSDEQFQKEFEEYRAPYKDGPFNIKVMAMTFKGYPSFEVYKNRWRLERSYEHLIAKEINDDSLKAHLERASRFLNDGKLSVHLIRIPAWDDETGTWRQNGFERARLEAQRVFDEIASKKMPFEAAKTQFSKWPSHIEHQGFLGIKGLNELRQELEETEYTDFISGFSVANELFYKGEVGNVMGPLRGQKAYYIAFIASRTPASGSMDLSDKNQRDLVKQDYLSYRFLNWANEVASRTTVK